MLLIFEISILKRGKFSSKKTSCKVRGRSARAVHVMLVRGKRRTPRYLCTRQLPAYEAQSHLAMAPCPSSNSQTRSLWGNRSFYFLFNPPTNNFCSAKDSVRSPRSLACGWPQEHWGTFSASYQKQDGYSAKSIIGHKVSAVPQNGTTVSVPVSICKQCQFAEIGPPMGFHSTKNTINGFWPNLPMM